MIKDFFFSVVNECDSNPCVNGNCLDRVDSYFCQCPKFYTGINCETNTKQKGGGGGGGKPAKEGRGKK